MNKKHLIGYPVTALLALTIGAAGASGSSTAPVAAESVPSVTVTVISPAPKPAAPKPAAKPKVAATVDPVVTAITERYGDCLTKLKFTQPFDINVYSATHKADVSGTPGVIGFRTATSNTGSLLIIPEDSDNSARALASVGC